MRALGFDLGPGVGLDLLLRGFGVRLRLRVGVGLRLCFGLGLGVDPRLFGNGSGGVGSGPFLGLDLHLGAGRRFLVFDHAVDVGVVDVVLRQVAAPADRVKRIARNHGPPLS